MKEGKLTHYPNRKRRPLYFMKQIIIFARETLMRQGEIFNLKRKDVDFLNGTAIIRKTKNNTPRKIGLSPLATHLSVVPRLLVNRLPSIDTDR